MEMTGARGLAGDLFVDGALGSRTAWLHEPYTDAPDRCGNTYLDPEAITAHLHACTEAGIPAGFHVIGDAAVGAVVDAVAARGRPARHAGRRALRAPTRAPGDGDSRAVGPAGRVGRHRKRATELRRAVGRRSRDVCAASRPGQSPAAQSAGAVSIPRRATRLRLRFAGHQHESVGDRPCRNPAPDTVKRDIDARGILGGDPRRMARRRGARRCHRNTRAGRTRVLRGVGHRRAGGQRPRRRGATVVDRPAVAGTGAAPAGRRRPAAPMRADRSPRCCRSMVRRIRASGHADDDTDSFPVFIEEKGDGGVSDREAAPDDEAAPDEATPDEAGPDHEVTPAAEAATKREAPAWLKRFGDAVVARLPRHQRRRRRGDAALPELPALRLVVHGDRRVRAAGLGADPATPPSSSADSGTACSSGRPSTSRCCRGPA